MWEAAGHRHRRPDRRHSVRCSRRAKHRLSPGDQAGGPQRRVAAVVLRGCGQPVTGEFLNKKFHWHKPWLYLLVLISPIIYVIIAAILMKHVSLLVPMCDEHRQRRKNFLIATWVLGLGFIPGGIVVGSLIHDSDMAVALGFLTAFVLLIAAL
jgi:hypothetical protein